jgi:hypothetical protein
MEAGKTMSGNQGFGEALGGAPGAKGVGTGRADAYFEHIEDGDGFVGQGCEIFAKVGCFWSALRSQIYWVNSQKNSNIAVVIQK